MVKVNPKLNAEIRNVFGRKVKQLRKAGLVPATVYGKGVEAVSIQANLKELSKIYDEVGESGLVDLMVNEQAWPILFKNAQYHPLNEEMIHIDCHKVNLKEKIVATVPIELIGESEAVKLGNVLIEVTQEIEVEALPANLPDKIEIDISVLKDLDSVITVGDIKLDDKVEIKTDLSQVIAKVEEPKEEVVEEVATEVSPEDVVATEQKAPSEGEEDEKKEEEK